MRALFVHGVGQQELSFADDARKWLNKSFPGSAFHSVWWAPLADRAENKFLQAVEAKGSKGKPSQKLVVGTLSDALMYPENAKLRADCAQALDDGYKHVGGPVTIFAHSLGCLLVTDWLRARPGVKVEKLVTMGCNLGLFNLGRKFEPVPQAQGRWLNLWHKNDMLGYPLDIDSIERVEGVKDVQVSFGWFEGWTGLAHTRYWGAKNIWTDVVPKELAAK